MTQGSFVSAGVFRVLIVVLLTAVFTQLCIQESKVHGRLMTAPNYDDVTYFWEGSKLLQSIKESGAEGLFSYLKQSDLHSPYSIGLAGASYALFGYRESAPYWGNLLLILLFLGSIGWRLRSLPLIAWIGGLILFLTPPMITMGVVEFRPDIAWALTTGFGVVFLVTESEVFRDPRKAALAGLWLGLSLLIKPSTFVMTCILYCGAVASRIIEALWSRGKRQNQNGTEGGKVISLWAGVAFFLLTLLVVAGPYWARYGRTVANYFLENSFGTNKAVWVFVGTTSDSLRYYVTGDGAQCNIGRPGLILSFLSVGCFVLLWLKRPEWRWKLFVLVGLMMGALFINTIALMKSPFLGGGIYGLWIQSCAFVIAGAYPIAGQMMSRWGGTWRNWLLWIVAVAALLTYHWPPYSNWGADRIGDKNYRDADHFMTHLLEDHARSLPHGILFMQEGPILLENAGLWITMHGKVCAIQNGAFIPNSWGFQHTYPNYDWIVIQEPGVMGAALNMPSEKLLPEYLQILGKDPGVHPIASFTAANGKKVWVYEKIAAPDAGSRSVAP